MAEKNELTLWDLCLTCFQAIGRAIAWCYHLCLNSLRLAIQRWYIVLAFVALGVAGACYYSRVGNKIYKTGVMVHLNGVNRTDVIRVYESLALATPSLINTNQSLSTLLSLPDENVSTLRRFETRNVIDFCHDSVPDVIDYKQKAALEDTINIVAPNYLYLMFRTKRPQEAHLVGNAIIDFLNKDTGLQASYQATKAIWERRSLFCQTQIERLDSLTRSFYFDQNVQHNNAVQYDRWSTSLLVGERSIELIHPAILALIEEATWVNQELATATAPIVTMGEWTVNPSAVNRLSISLLLGFLIGYIVGCLVALAVVRHKQIKEWICQKQ